MRSQVKSATCSRFDSNPEVSATPFGKEQDAESYAINRGVEVVPTVMLVDENGNELVPKIVGYQTPGIYDAYLDKAIEVSQMLLEQR